MFKEQSVYNYIFCEALYLLISFGSCWLDKQVLVFDHLWYIFMIVIL